MTRYLDPKIDLVFQRVFGCHEEILVDLLNALLPLDDPIVTLTYLPREQIPDAPLEGKLTVLDVQCQDNKGRLFVVEMQMRWRKWDWNRFFFYTARTYGGQLEKSKSVGAIKPVYTLVLVNDIFDRESPNYYHRYRMSEENAPDQVIEGMELIFIELPKFSTDHPHMRFAMKKAHSLWLRFLREIDESNKKPDPEFMRNEQIVEALRLVEEAAFTAPERALYQKEWDLACLALTFQEDEEDRARRHAQGVAEGLERGQAEGIADSLLLILQARFGVVPAEVEAQIKQAPVLELKSWLARALTATTLTEIFKEF